MACSTCSFCGSVTSPVHALLLGSSGVQSHTMTSSWEPRWSAVLLACMFSSAPMPTRVSETKRVSTTAMCIERLRRSPCRSSLKT